ncbi:SANT/Myb-like DNA-binding domain-containing protein [Nitrobacter sp.]|uniref:SANT/Myb-like DNA-binding domain-containing protein n=1 Tax=Nitrobacter sp. TaxID=29420 RepID=UPI003F651933
MVKPRTWSDDENARLLQLEAEKLPREEIAQRLRKTRQQVTAQIGKLRARQNTHAHSESEIAVVRRCDPGAPWTEEEIERLIGLGSTARGMGEWGVIARTHFPGRTPTACKQQYFHSRGARHDPAEVEPRDLSASGPSAAAAPVWRQAPQSITAAVFGDPPPGRSALDQRRHFSQTRGLS